MTAQIQAQALLIPRPETRRADDSRRSGDGSNLRGFDDIFEEKQGEAAESSSHGEAEASEESAQASSQSESRTPGSEEEHDQEHALKRADASGVVPHDLNTFIDRPITIHAFNQRILNAGSTAIEGAVAAKANEVRTGQDQSSTANNTSATATPPGQGTDSGAGVSTPTRSLAGTKDEPDTQAVTAAISDHSTNGVKIASEQHDADRVEPRPSTSTAKPETVTSQPATGITFQHHALWDAGARLAPGATIKLSAGSTRDPLNQTDGIASAQSNKDLTPTLELSHQSQRGGGGGSGGDSRGSSDRRGEDATRATLTRADADDASNLREDGAFVAQVTRGLSDALKRSDGSTVLRLQPHALGQLRIDVRETEQGVLARFQASSDQARQLLESSMSTLRSALEARGVVVGQLHVETVRPVRDSAEPRMSRQLDARAGHTPSSRGHDASIGGAAPTGVWSEEEIIGNSIRAEHGSNGEENSVAASWLGEPEIEGGGAAEDDWLSELSAERSPGSVESESGPETAMPRALDARRAYRPGLLLALGIDRVA